MSQLLSPISLLLLGLLLGTLTLRCRHRVLPGIAGGLVLLALAGMTPWVANRLVRQVEHRITGGPGDCGPVELIVLLAGGLAYPPRAGDDYAALSDESLARTLAFRQVPLPADVPLLIAGGGHHAVAEATLIAALLHQLDPTLAPILLETASTTTWESAGQLVLLLPPPRTIALASSALHLPRAARAFRAAGYTVCPWPLQRRALTVGGIGAWTPQSSALRKTEAALHEIVGDLAYRWRSR